MAESKIDPHRDQMQKTPTTNIATFIGWLLLALVGCLFLLGCDDGAEEVIYVTEEFEFEDEILVVTKAVTPTPPPEAATPIPPTRVVIPDPIELDIAQIRTFSIPDPQRTTNQEAIDLIENLYIGLTNFNHRSQKVDPELAAQWSVSPDGLVWTFFLRNDVYWVQAKNSDDSSLISTDGDEPLVEINLIRPISADDVVFALERACDPTTNAPHIFVIFIISGCEQISRETGLTDEAKAAFGVKALDNLTVEIRLTEPAPYFAAITTLPFFKPLPRDRVESDELDWLDSADFVASGPFVWSPRSDPEREGDPLTVLQKNSAWPLPLQVWDNNPEDLKGNVELINIYEVDSRGEAFALWDKNQIDLTLMPFSQSQRFLDSPLDPPPLVTAHEVFYLGFNMDSAAFSLPTVRRAFSMAINRQQLLEEVYGRRGKVMTHFAPPGALHAPPIDKVGQDFWESKAIQQLNESGYVNCINIGPIKYLIRDSDEARQHAEALIDMWSRTLGCQLSQFEIEQVQFGKVLANTHGDSANRPDLFDLGWASYYPDAHNWYMPVLHCLEGENRMNRRCTIDDDTDALLEAAAVSTDPEFRSNAYLKAETLLFGEAGSFPIAPLYVRGDYILKQGWVQKEEERESDPTFDHERWYPAIFGGEQFDTYWIDSRLKEIERTQ